jgi:hypothetical protein
MSDHLISLFGTMYSHLALLCFQVTAFAQAGGASQEPWYKITTGVIAIPAALVGLVFSYRVLRKTNLEARKLELEILEKQEKFRSAPEGEGLQALKELVERGQSEVLNSHLEIHHLGVDPSSVEFHPLCST